MHTHTVFSPIVANSAGASTERRASARQSGQQEEAAPGIVVGLLRAEATAKEKGVLFAL